MANYAVNYSRPAKSLLRVRDELNAVFPGRFTGTDGFITGYDSPANPRYGVSGHNPNSLGHVMAYDISTPANGQQIDEVTGRALADYLRTKANEKFRYLIHDMGPAAPEPKITGDFNGWGWGNYDGVAHSDHIHISITDDYQWGESCGTSQEIYDDESSWGIAEWYAAYTAGAEAPGATPGTPAPKPTPTNPAPATAGTFVAVVEDGDSLTAIAAQFGTSVDAILAINNVPNPDSIYPGQMMNIPGAAPVEATPSAGLVDRRVTNDVAFIRTAPRSGAPLVAHFPEGIAQGELIAVKGYVAGEDPYGTGDDAWYVTDGDFYLWANAAENSLAGLRKLG